ncbi:MAG: type II toxin-antitoxin system death-on-curing family toxin [Chthoniobacteraceae bacterium]
MPEHRFISRDVLAQLHADSITRFGGTLGVRDESLILSALGAAENTHYFGCGDLFDIAAAYAFHLAQAQAFLDGNKRTAVAAALLFLRANGIAGRPDQARLYSAMIAIAERRLDKPGLAALFRELFA